jgi:capsular polysaccharide biosynthesis protein
VDLWRGIKLVRLHSLWFFFGALISFVLIMVAPLFSGKAVLVYKSSAKVLITPTTTGITLAGERQNTGPVRSWFADEATLRTLLVSQDLLDLVIESTGLTINWSELRERVQLEIVSSGAGNQVSLLEISVLANKGEESRLLSLTLAEKFIQYIQQLSAAEQDKTVAFIERERRNAEREVARAQKKLLQLGIVPRGAGPDPIEQNWVQLQARRSELERDYALAESEIEQIDVLNGGAGIDGLKGDPFDNSVSQERVKLAELREVFTDRSPQVKAQRAKLDRLEAIQSKQKAVTMDSARERTARKAQKIKQLLDETLRRLRVLESGRPSAEKHLEYATQERQLNMWQENYLDLTRQLYRARVAQQSSRRDGAFTIVEKPMTGRVVSGQVAASSPLGRAALGFPLSLICGLLIVMGVDYFESSLRLEPRIEESLGLPVIGRIPTFNVTMVSDWDQMKASVAPTGRPRAEAVTPGDPPVSS